MKIERATTPPPEAPDWKAAFEQIADEPGVWQIVTDHGMKESSVRPFASKVTTGNLATAEAVARDRGGHFVGRVHEGNLYFRFVPH